LSVHRADAAPFPEHLFLDPDDTGSGKAAADQEPKHPQPARNIVCPAAYSPGKSPFRPISPDRSQHTPVRSGGSAAAFVDTSDVVKASLMQCGILTVASETPFQKPVGSGSDLGGSVIDNLTESVEVSSNAQNSSASSVDISEAQGITESVKSQVAAAESLQSSLDLTITDSGAKTDSIGMTVAQIVDSSSGSVAMELSSADAATTAQPEQQSASVPPASSVTVDATLADGVSSVAELDSDHEEMSVVVTETSTTLVSDTVTIDPTSERGEITTVSEQQVYLTADGSVVEAESVPAAAAADNGQEQQHEEEEQEQPFMIIVEPSASAEEEGGADGSVTMAEDDDDDEHEHEQVVHVAAEEEGSSTVQIISVDASGTPSDQSTYVTVQPKGKIIWGSTLPAYCSSDPKAFTYRYA
jgi:hypothetical protein